MINIKSSIKDIHNPVHEIVGLINLLFTTNGFLIPCSLQGLRENLLFHGKEAAVEFEILQIYAVVLSRWNNAELWIYLP